MSNVSFNLVAFDGEAEQGVDARDLHEQLKIGRDFSTWIKERIENAQLIENQDFIRSPILGSEHKIEYTLSIDAAKHISMLERTEIGRQVRQYFIDIEKRAREHAVQTSNYLNDFSTQLIPITEAQREVNEQMLKFNEDINELKKALPFSDEFKAGVSSPIAYLRGMVASAIEELRYISGQLTEFPQKILGKLESIETLLKKNHIESVSQVKNQTGAEYVTSKISDLLSEKSFSKSDLTRKTQRLTQNERDSICEMLVETGFLEKTVVGNEISYRVMQ